MENKRIDYAIDALLLQLKTGEQRKQVEIEFIRESRKRESIVIKWKDVKLNCFITAHINRTEYTVRFKATTLDNKFIMNSLRVGVLHACVRTSTFIDLGERFCHVVEKRLNMGAKNV